MTAKGQIKEKEKEIKVEHRKVEDGGENVKMPEEQMENIILKSKQGRMIE